MLPPQWLAQIEGRAVIAMVADEFVAAVHPCEQRSSEAECSHAYPWSFSQGACRWPAKA